MAGGRNEQSRSGDAVSRPNFAGLVTETLRANRSGVPLVVASKEITTTEGD
jgi:hypothetical protein